MKQQIKYIVFAGFFLWVWGAAYNAAAGQPDPVLEKRMAAMGVLPLPGMLPPADDELQDMDGQRVRLSDFKGKIVFLNFWTTWCPDCIEEMPDIEKLHKKITDKDFIIIALDLKEPAKRVKSFMERHNLGFTILLDSKGRMGRAFGIRSIPTTFILNREGGMIGKAMGPRKWGSRKSVELFEYLINKE